MIASRTEPVVGAWLAKRDEELAGMEVALHGAPRLEGAVRLHAQRAAEAALKALVAAAGGEAEAGCDLVLLAGRASELVPALSLSGADCYLLTVCAAMPRAPGRGDGGSVPAAVVVEACRRVLCAVDRALGA